MRHRGRVRSSPLMSHDMPRADQLLVQQGLVSSRTAAQRLIEGGRVHWRSAKGGQVVTRASQAIPDGCMLEVTPDPDADRYVSRGAWKLHGALSQTGITVTDKACLDVGQSTGGFTDCLLQAGARSVTGIDVGHDQLHARLRDDPRVTTIEGCNARHLDPTVLGATFPEGGFPVIVADVSFISLTLILGPLTTLLAANGSMLLLVKPQFEVGREHLGKGGIVRDTTLHGAVEDKLRCCACDAGLRVRAWLDSPITGGDGNREFFLWTEHEHI